MDDSTESGDVGVSKTRKKSGIVTISLRESFPFGEALSSILYKQLYAPAGSQLPVKINEIFRRWATRR